MCAARIDVSILAFLTAVLLSMATFMIGGTLAFLLSRRMLDPSCTRKVIRQSKVLDGESVRTDEEARKASCRQSLTY